MRFSALVIAAIAILSASASFAGDLDGTWTGKWGDKASAKVSVSGDKVTSYYYQGSPQKIGSTKASKTGVSFGSGYTVKVTLTGKNTAHASYRSDRGSAEAELVRK
ncbi:hypothetical protein [Rhizobium sp. 18055]|uniref:hypothetical protein n=1 Tax=Rhizobium sp. 18055 TaxID=2681403 RepID=UPI00135BE15D|nr:hypothetical protein [Rhizobium sp. 18055]